MSTRQGVQHNVFMDAVVAALSAANALMSAGGAERWRLRRIAASRRQTVIGIVYSWRFPPSPIGCCGCCRIFISLAWRVQDRLAGQLLPSYAGATLAGAGAVVFEVEHDAISGLLMGAVEKIALQFNKNIFNIGEAGEALSILKHSSLPGAYDTGQAAARLVLQALSA